MTSPFGAQRNLIIMKLKLYLLLTVGLALVSLPIRSLHAQIYVVRNNGFAGVGAVGEYNFDGSAINSNLISGLNLPWGIAVSPTNIYVSDYANGTVGEFTLSGAPVNTSLISGLGSPHNLLISGGNLYVLNQSSGSLGEYTLAGAPINSSLISGLGSPVGVTISDNFIYVAINDGTVGKYNLDGTSVNTSLISGETGLDSLASAGSFLFLGTNGNIAEYDVNGNLIDSSLTAGNGDNDYLTTYGGNLYAVSRSGGSVAEFTTAGATIDAGLITSLYQPDQMAAVPEASTWVSPALLASLILFRTNRARRRRRSD
jgi:hypothetical protein